MQASSPPLRVEAEARPCPFCGHNGATFETHGGQANLVHVVCMRCSGAGPGRCGYAEAIDAWNGLEGA